MFWVLTDEFHLQRMQDIVCNICAYYQSADKARPTICEEKNQVSCDDLCYEQLKE